MLTRNRTLTTAAGIACACLFTALPLTSHANTLLSAYIEHDGWSVSDIQHFNQDAQKSLGAVTIFTNFDYNWDFLTIQSSNIVAQNATPIITWMPYSQHTPDMLSAIVTGEQDDYIDQWITDFKAWLTIYPTEDKPRIFMRFGHEFNGNWYPWANQPELFKVAWRYVHQKFVAANVNDSVDWVWCINNFDVDNVNDITQYYPGDDVVDWTAVDGYNWGSNYSFSSWTDFDQTFSYAYRRLISNYPDKPIMVAEVGSAEPSDRPDPIWGQNGDDRDRHESKADWVAQMYQRIQENYPAIRAVSWFNINKELSWSLNGTAKSGSANTGILAYQQQTASPHYINDYHALLQTEITQINPLSFDDLLFATLQKVSPLFSVQTASAAENNGNGNRGSNGLKGIQHAINVSNMPDVVGERLLQRMSNGFRHLPPEALENIKRSRLHLR